MVDCARHLPDVGTNLLFIIHVRARTNLGKEQRAIRLSGDDLTSDAERGHGPSHVIFIGKIVGEDAWHGASGSIGQLDLAATLRPAHTKVEAEAGPPVE